MEQSPRLDSRVIGHDRSIAKDARADNLDASAELTMPSGDDRAEFRARVDRRVRPDDGAVDDRVFADVALAADHAVGTDPRAALDDDVGVDEARDLDRRARVDARRWRNQRR